MAPTEGEYRRSNNNGMNVILGILVAVILVAGGYYFMKRENAIDANTAATIEAPTDTAPAAGTSGTTDGTMAPSTNNNAPTTDGGVAP